MASCAAGQVEGHRPRALAEQPARALRRAGADLEHPGAGQRRRVAEQVRVGLVESLGAPHEAVVAQERRRARPGSRPPRRPTTGGWPVRSRRPPPAGARRRRPWRRRGAGKSARVTGTSIPAPGGYRRRLRRADVSICVVWTLRCGPALPHQEQACAREGRHRLPAPSRAPTRRRSFPGSPSRLSETGPVGASCTTDPCPETPTHMTTTTDARPETAEHRVHHPRGRDQRHRLGRGLPRRRRPHDQVLQRWRHRRGHHRQGRP